MSFLEIEKMKKCYKYKFYDTAIYLASFLMETNTEYKLLLGIFLYENNEYSRSIFHLKEITGSPTAFYYLALNLKKIKKYDDAIYYINLIQEMEIKIENPNDKFLTNFIINPHDSEFFNCFLGELYILKGKSAIGIEHHKKSFIKNPLLSSLTSLMDENIVLGKYDSENDILMNLYHNIMEFNIQNKGSSAIFESVGDFRSKNKLIDYYIPLVPGVGSYFISKLASIDCKYGKQCFGIELFEILRQRDPHFIIDLDVYSTSLWISKNESALAFLSQELISSHFTDYITWSVTANYYSLRGMTEESSTCLMKSLTIKENPFAYSLMGFELNSKNQFLEAQTYFKSSLCMLENNDKAYFGMGIALNETSKKRKAEPYFNRALKLNKDCLNMKVYLIRVYASHNEINKALELSTRCLNIESDNINDIAEIIFNNFGKYNEMEELIICELAGIFNVMKFKGLAKKIIECVQCRTSSYYKKKCMIETED